MYMVGVENLKIYESMFPSHNNRVVLAFSAETREIPSQAMRVTPNEEQS